MGFLTEARTWLLSADFHLKFVQVRVRAESQKDPGVRYCTDDDVGCEIPPGDPGVTEGLCALASLPPPSLETEVTWCGQK